MKYSDTELYLYELDNNKLNNVLSLSEKEKKKYFMQLVDRFYPDSSSDYIPTLLIAYYTSFLLESILRENEVLAAGFTPIYTPTGLIRELANDIYKLDEDISMQIH